MVQRHAEPFGQAGDVTRLVLGPDVTYRSVGLVACPNPVSRTERARDVGDRELSGDRDDGGANAVLGKELKAFARSRRKLERLQGSGQRGQRRGSIPPGHLLAGSSNVRPRGELFQFLHAFTPAQPSGDGEADGIAPQEGAVEVEGNKTNGTAGVVHSAIVAKRCTRVTHRGPFSVEMCVGKQPRTLTNDRLSTVFDFECCGPGFRAWDLAAYRWSTRRQDEIWSSFLRGYTECRPLGEADRAAIPLFVAVREIWLLGSRCANARDWGALGVDERVDRGLAFLRASAARASEESA